MMTITTNSSIRVNPRPKRPRDCVGNMRLPFLEEENGLPVTSVI